MTRLPFEEEKCGEVRLRTFSAETDPDELVWHRDDEDRTVSVVEADGWYFQKDGELPKLMAPGDTLYVRRHEWHRVIMRKSTRLVVEISTC